MKKNKMYEWRVGKHLVIFSTDGFCRIPAWCERFRVGPWVGNCIIKVPGFVVMKGSNCYE